MAISDPSEFRMHMFVDDPIYVAKQDSHADPLALTRALLWASVAGFPLAWHKSDGGKAVTWISALIGVDEKDIIVTTQKIESRNQWRCSKISNARRRSA